MKDYSFFSSPIGLGHVTRDIAIVNNFENVSMKFCYRKQCCKNSKKNRLCKTQDVYNPPSFIIEEWYILKNPAKMVVELLSIL